MKQRVMWTVLLMVTVSAAKAHFVFVLPQSGGSSAKVIMNEELTPSSEVDIGLLSALKLSLRKGDGSENPLVLVKGEGSYDATLPGSGTRLVHGTVDLGMMQRGPGKPNILIYYPKAITGDAFSAKTVIGNSVPVELVPVGKEGALTLRLLVMGKPQADGEITVILPDGSQKKVKTDKNGVSEQFTQTGRYGAWARYWETSAGERDGKHYEEIRHYATLVFDAGAPVVKVTATRFATLPQGTSSFGAAVSDGWLYVYGGHVSRTHTYSTDSVSGRFDRLRLSGAGVWESLPAGPPLQGMNLLSSGGKIYRIGGMSPRNKPGDPQAIYSVADCARFDPATMEWEALPSLPEPLSSHDVVAVDGKLIVTGGWNLKGTTTDLDWSSTLQILDLKADKLEWKSAPQPFKRRALIAAVMGAKMYVLGGIDEKTNVSHDVNIFDVGTGSWTKGPAVPGDEISSFAPAACVHTGRLYVSVADGTVYRLDASKGSWEKIGAASPRLAHRMVSDGQKLLVIGGAQKGENSNLVEAVIDHP